MTRFSLHASLLLAHLVTLLPTMLPLLTMPWSPSSLAYGTMATSSVIWVAVSSEVRFSNLLPFSAIGTNFTRTGKSNTFLPMFFYPPSMKLLHSTASPTRPPLPSPTSSPPNSTMPPSTTSSSSSTPTPRAVYFVSLVSVLSSQNYRRMESFLFRLSSPLACER
jgi:hypothetical protein